jgi:ABC-type transport system involved in cytochrome c biogenesis permease subunit
MDGINCAFEFGGALMLLLNVFRLVKDKRIAGVAILPTAFFAVWGVWNLAYYPSLGQWASFVGGVAVVVVNSVWVGLALHYSRRKEGV